MLFSPHQARPGRPGLSDPCRNLADREPASRNFSYFDPAFGTFIGTGSATAELLNTKVTSATINAVANVKTLVAFLIFKYLIILTFSPFRSNIVNYSLAVGQVRRLTCNQLVDQLLRIKKTNRFVIAGTVSSLSRKWRQGACSDYDL